MAVDGKQRVRCRRSGRNRRSGRGGSAVAWVCSSGLLRLVDADLAARAVHRHRVRGSRCAADSAFPAWCSNAAAALGRAVPGPPVAPASVRPAPGRRRFGRWPRCPRRSPAGSVRGRARPSGAAVGRAAGRRGAGDGPGRPSPTSRVPPPSAPLLTLVLLLGGVHPGPGAAGLGRTSFRSHSARPAPGFRDARTVDVSPEGWPSAVSRHRRRPEPRKRRIGSGDLRTPAIGFQNPGRRQARRQVLDDMDATVMLDPPRPPP